MTGSQKAMPMLSIVRTEDNDSPQKPIGVSTVLPSSSDDGISPGKSPITAVSSG
jgi:hypothetical protein